MKHRMLLVAILLSVPLLVAGKWPAPVLEGSDEASRVLADAFRGQPPRALSEWMSWAHGQLADHGWAWAEVRADTSETRGAWALEVRPGPRMRVERLDVRGADPELTRVWQEISGIREGGVLQPIDWSARVRRGLVALSERGFAFASVTILDQRTDAETGAVDLVLLLRPGSRMRIRSVVVEGATRTRPDVLARLSGLVSGGELRESGLKRAERRLSERPGLLAMPPRIDVRPVPGLEDEADVVLNVEQPDSRGTFAAAAGVVTSGADERRVSGQVDLQLFDLFGTARSFSGRWYDDGRTRRRLDFDYVEPAALGTPLDVGVSLGQRHEDGSFDLVRGEVVLRLPSGLRRSLQFSLGTDRTTFEGAVARVRWRQRLGAEVGLQWTRDPMGGYFGNLRSSVQAARVRDETTDVGRETTTQTLVEIDGSFGRAFGGRVAARTALSWRGTETPDLPLPRSEQWALGGASTVRGHAEERFLGERVAYARSELLLGSPSRGQGYLFFDYGWVRTTSDGGGGTMRDENWLRGYGIGVLSPTALGKVDLSLGFSEGIGLEGGKLHLVLQRSF